MNPYKMRTDVSPLYIPYCMNSMNDQKLGKSIWLLTPCASQKMPVRMGEIGEQFSLIIYSSNP